MSIFRKQSKLDYYSAAMRLKEIIPTLKDDRLDDIYNDLQSSNLEFYKVEKITTKPWVRLTLPLVFIVLIILLILSPVKFVITGKWNYDNDRLLNWIRSVGL